MPTIMDTVTTAKGLSCFDSVFNNPKLALAWTLVRLYVGWEWLSAGYAKLSNPLWFGPDAGAPLAGFLNGAIAKTGGLHPDVYMWYASFLNNVVLPHAHLWSYFVSCGEFLVGVGLLLGFLTGVSACFGAFMNLNYMLAGTVSVNPTFYTLGILLMLSWKVSGLIGLDRFVLPYIRQHWHNK